MKRFLRCANAYSMKCGCATLPRTRSGYIRTVSRFYGWLGCSPDTVTVEELRRYQLHLVDHVISPSSDEFMRRFLLHVLPGGFHWIRHYGLIANAGCGENLAKARELLPV